MEKAYKTMKQVGALNIALGVITIVTGLVVGILTVSYTHLTLPTNSRV